jgi:hypothetical protein
VLCVVTGCGSDRESAVTGTADRFERAVQERDFAAACGLLAPKTREEVGKDQPCDQALGDEKLPDLGGSPATEVYGRQAQVRGRSDTLFLAEFADGWRVVAAGCARRADRPYDCAVQGG